MKYIISKDKDVVIFSEGLIHAEVARKLHLEVESAGFINNELKPYGDSFSLGVGTNKDSEDIIKRHFNRFL